MSKPDNGDLFEALMSHWITRLIDRSLDAFTRDAIRSRFFELEKLHTATVYLRWGNPINRREIEQFVSEWKNYE